MIGAARTRTTAEPGPATGLGSAVKVRGSLFEERTRAWWVAILFDAFQLLDLLSSGKPSNIYLIAGPHHVPTISALGWEIKVRNYVISPMHPFSIIRSEDEPD